MPTDYWDDATQRIMDAVRGIDPPAPCDEPDDPPTDEPPARACMICGRADEPGAVVTLRTPYILAPTIADDERRLDMWTCASHDELAHCADCMELISTRHSTRVGTLYYCDDCTQERLDDGTLATCDDCGGISASSRMTYIDSNGANICPACRSNYYARCPDCDEWNNTDYMSYDEDEGRYYCDECYSEHAHGTIGQYHSQNKVTCFLGEGAHHHGIEIEMECSSDHASAASEARRLWPDEAICFERDGSLDDGFELITNAPFTSEYLRTHREQVAAALASLISNGCRSHNTSTCGMHIHTSWPALGTLKAEQDYNSTKLVLITERFPDDMDKLARRRPTHYCPKLDTTDPLRIEATKGNVRGAWNFQERDTFEFRHPRGTLNVDTVYATVELVDALVRAATRLSIERIQKAKTLAEILRAANGGRIRAELLAYMERRGVATDTMNAADRPHHVGDTEPGDSTEDAAAELHTVSRW